MVGEQSDPSWSRSPSLQFIGTVWALGTVLCEVRVIGANGVSVLGTATTTVVVNP